MSAPLAIHHLAVAVSDLERAEAFYVRVLGLPVVRRWNDDAGLPRSIWVGLAPSTGAPAAAVPFLALEVAGAAGPKRSDAAPGWHAVAFAIAAYERVFWRERLAAAGHPIERESPYSLYARDPDGNLVALSHYPEPAS